MYTKGWDAFQPDPGVEDKMFCRVCGEEMEVRRNVEGPRSYTEAVGGGKSLHDSFVCKNSGEKWHQQALEILKMAEKTPSKVMEEMLKKEVQEIIESKCKFGADFLYKERNNATLSKWLLLQSGPLIEFGKLEIGDQIEIMAFEVSIFGIKIVAKFGDQERTFYLKTQRVEK
jgi:hypothetical protein